MRKRNPRIGWHSDGAADARNDREGDARRRTVQGLFPPTPKDKGIATFETDDSQSLSGFFHQQRINLRLLENVIMLGFSGVDPFSMCRGFIE